ncbi:MAG TPA: tryptophan synthase subunit beta [Planctomycetota bacterium]|nr:tryptophan synthase subunit beta [Planctomycetota bacterium]
MQLPDANGHFGEYGGRFIPEVLFAALEQVEACYRAARKDKAFQAELDALLRDYVGRPTPLCFARRLSERYKAKIYLKREDLAHTGAHKINNTIGQGLLAVRMGKKRVVAETGAGQHGVATATAAAMLGLECVIYMGAEDVRRQALNVFRMRQLGAEVHEVTGGSQTLKDAINEALRDWAATVGHTHFVFGSVAGVHPFPMIVRDFQSVIGREAREQILQAEGRLPDYLLACVGGGSNSIGLFYPFLEDASVKMIGVEAGGRGIEPGQHAARFAGGSVGVLHGARSWLLQTDDGQISLTHSISAGLDYAMIGPEHSHLHDTGRVEYTWIGDDDAVAAFQRLCRLEGIIPALESSHAAAYLEKMSGRLTPDTIVIVNLSGRGDKDVNTVADYLKSR